jgi:hypothetical protein
MKFFIFIFFLISSFFSYSKDPSGQTFGLGYSTSNVEHLDTSIVVSFVERVNFACKTKEEKAFFDLFSHEVNFDIFYDKTNNRRYGISSRKGQKLSRFMSLICSQLIKSNLKYFQNPENYEYGILDFKKKRDSLEDEPVWFTRLCVYQNDFCKLSIKAVIEKNELRIDEH